MMELLSQPWKMEGKEKTKERTREGVRVREGARVEREALNGVSVQGGNLSATRKEEVDLVVGVAKGLEAVHEDGGVLRVDAEEDVAALKVPAINQNFREKVLK